MCNPPYGYVSGHGKGWKFPSYMTAMMIFLVWLFCQMFGTLSLHQSAFLLCAPMHACNSILGFSSRRNDTPSSIVAGELHHFLIKNIGLGNRTRLENRIGLESEAKQRF